MEKWTVDVRPEASTVCILMRIILAVVAVVGVFVVQSVIDHLLWIGLLVAIAGGIASTPPSYRGTIQK